MAEDTVERTPTTHRMAWLDALRGIAALAVVFDHTTQSTLRSLRPHVYPWFDPGNYGVFVFFLVSGYIVPASLERKGSVRTFWVSRAFRLYPMYLVTIALVLMLWGLGQMSLRGAETDPVNSVFAQLLMMGDVLAGPNVPNVVWSLTYEMAFYLLLTFLFIAGINRPSWRYALGFAIAAVVLGGAFPKQFFSGHLAGPAVISVVADVLIAASLVGAIALRGRPRLIAAVVAAATALLLVATNTHSNWVYTWEIPTILALMFTGTTLYRAEHGQCSWRTAIFTASATTVLTIAAGIWHSHAWHIGGAPELYWERRWFSALFLAVATFGAGMLLRHHRVPRWIAWLGLISYSMYLLHPLVLAVLFNEVIRGHWWYPVWLQALIVLVYLIVLIGISSATYLLVERPTQLIGRRVGRWLDGRCGPDRLRPEPVRHAGPRATDTQRPADVSAGS